MVYTSQSRSLAALETLVHLERPQLLEIEFVFIMAAVPDELILSIDISSLGEVSNVKPDLRRTQKIGDAWLASGQSLALRVPTAIVPGEFNVLLSPDHPDWPLVNIGQPEPFGFDRRLGA